MIVFAFLVAFVDVFIISQVSFWGAVPLLYAVIVYLIRYEARFIELVLGAAIYGLVWSTFVSRSDALLVFAVQVVATIVSVGLLRTIGQSRLRVRLKGYDAALIAATFTVTHWALHAVAAIDSLLLSRFAVFVAWSAVLNLSLMIIAELVNRRIRV